MKQFVFIIPRTPKQFSTPLRNELFDITLRSLKQQPFKDWEAIVIDDHDREEANIRYVKTDRVTKSEKLQFALEFIDSQQHKPKYLIRLDDDDIISPNILQQVSQLDFDCYTDRFHTCLNLINGKIHHQQCNCFPNTVIHKYECALDIFGDEQKPLLLNKHTQWHKYYENKNVLYAKYSNPVYLRVLSPTTRTAKNPSLVYNVSDIDFDSYTDYLTQFGKGFRLKLKGFEEQLFLLQNLWEVFAFMRSETLPNNQYLLAQLERYKVQLKKTLLQFTNALN